VGCITLGRGEDEKKVGEWLTTASHVPGFVGFAVGRTVFWQPLTDFRTNKITRNQAVLDIARRYSELVDTFQFGKSRAA
jgi:5-dehydro-2-deoxygluconokinase